jgi:homoserine dehydrogenase
LQVALIGNGNVGKAFARLLDNQKSRYPFRISGIHTLNHGTAYKQPGQELEFGPRAASIEEFLENSQPEVAIEITSLDPATGEPAISHIRAAFARGIHVITANKGPIAHAYRALKSEASSRQLLFRYESTVMDGAPVFNMVRNTLPGVKITGFSGALNSTTKVVIDALKKGHTIEDGVRMAQQMGIAETDASYDIDGWDSAAKTAALANVLMDANVTPQDVDRRGIGQLTPEKVADMVSKGKTPVLVSRARTTAEGIRLRVRSEVLDNTDLLASVQGTSNILLIDTDLMGTIGMVELVPQVEQTAYGLFSDLVDIAKSL